MKSDCESHIFGYRVDGIRVCPWCFENLGQAARESFTAADWFDAHFGKCDYVDGRCGASINTRSI
jgi:hypothetical protein